MNDLIEWLYGVLNNDEAAAKAATPGPWEPAPNAINLHDDAWEITTGLSSDLEMNIEHLGENVSRDGVEQDAAHIARHDPAQVLADIEAKRAVLELLNLTAGPHDPATGVLREVVKALARAYRHRPGWKSAWE